MDSINNSYIIDNDYLRCLHISVINIFNDKVYYQQIQSDGSHLNVNVPFFYTLSSDGRFLQDSYINFNECEDPTVDGNYDPIPRGTIFPKGWNIDQGAMTSNFVRINYTKLVDGEIRSYSANATIIPLIISYDCNIMTDTINQAHLIWQTMICQFMRTFPFAFRWNTIAVPARAGFREVPQFDFPAEIQYPTGRNLLSVSFPIDVETYLPCIDYTTEKFNGNTMRTIMPSTGVQGPYYGLDEYPASHWKDWSNISIEDSAGISPSFRVEVPSSNILRGYNTNE